MADETTAEQLRRIATFEAGQKNTPVTALLRKVGPTKAFAEIYRRIGPVVDPWLLHADHGRFISRVYGLPALLLHSVGRRSGEPRVSPLLYVRDGSAFVVTGTNFGQHQHPGWTANLLAHPTAEIEVGPVRLAVVAELADDGAWDRLWPKFVEMYPAYHAYLSRTDGRKPRIFVLRPD
jgi:deazaflavin-dependent oxidoreductase (nitroreductase family)